MKSHSTIACGIRNAELGIWDRAAGLVQAARTWLMSVTLNREQRASPSKQEAGRKPLRVHGSGVDTRKANGHPDARPLAPRLSPSAHRVPVAEREVFSINFIRHQTVPRAVRRALVYVALGYLVVNVAVMVGLLGAAGRSRVEWRTLQATLTGQLASSAEVSALKQEMATLRERAHGDLAQLNTAIVLQQQRFPVGAKLSSLSKTVPARTWIAGLSASRDTRTLTVQASYLIDSKRPYDLPTKEWIAALKADPDFRQGLRRLDLGSSSRKIQGSAELFVFELIAEWES